MKHFQERFNTQLAYLHFESVDDVEEGHFSRKLLLYEEEYFKRMCEAFEKPCGRATSSMPGPTKADESSSDSEIDGAAAPKKDDNIPMRSASPAAKAVDAGASSGPSGRAGAAAAVGRGRGGATAAVDHDDTLSDDDIPIPAVGRGRGGAAVAAPLCCGSAKAAAVGDLPNDDDMPIRALGRGHGGAAAAVGAGRKKSVAAVRDEKRPSLPVSRAER